MNAEKQRLEERKRLDCRKVFSAAGNVTLQHYLAEFYLSDDLSLHLSTNVSTNSSINLSIASIVYISINLSIRFICAILFFIFFSRERATLLVPLLQYIATPHMTFQVSRKRLVGSVINLPGEKSNSALLLNQLQKAWLMEAFFHIGYINKRYKCTDQAESFLYVFFLLIVYTVVARTDKRKSLGIVFDHNTINADL